MEKKQTMLIVDDKEINRAILASYFRDEFNILQAEDGQEALDYVYSQPIDIIMLDLVMPKMSGMEVLNKLKTNPRYSDIPVIVTTSVNDTTSEAFSMEQGAADYITKPYNPIIVRCVFLMCWAARKTNSLSCTKVCRNAALAKCSRLLILTS